MSHPDDKSVETPSGKGADDENFPVGSFLLPKALRPKVAIFYAYARAIDDIADNPALSAVDKINRLDGFDQALCQPTTDPAFVKATRVREQLGSTGQTIRHCRDLIIAFKQDAVQNRYDNWADLMHYCRHSAAPVGRFLLDLHDCAASGYPASDALCNALQVINHLQDCQDDYRTLDRVYLPTDWLTAAGETAAALDRPQASPGLRRVLDQCLAGVDELLAEARTLPPQLSSRRLGMEAAVIVRLATILRRRLGRQDPLARRVALSKPVAAGHALIAVVRYWLRLT